MKDRKERVRYKSKKVSIRNRLSVFRSNNHIRVTNCINIETSFPNFKHIMNTIGMKINEED